MYGKCSYCHNVLTRPNTCYTCNVFLKSVFSTRKWILMKCEANGASEVHPNRTTCFDCWYNRLRKHKNPLLYMNLSSSFDALYNYIGLEGVDISSVICTNYDVIAIQRLKRAFSIFSLVANRLHPIQKSPDNREVLTSLVTKSLYHVVYFLKVVPNFDTLDPDDKKELLKQSLVGLYLIAMRKSIDFDANAYIEDTTNINLVRFKDIWRNDLYTRTLEYLKTLNIDEEETVLCILMFLFDIRKKQMIKYNTCMRRMHTTAAHLLLKHYSLKYPTMSTSEIDKLSTDTANKINSLVDIQKSHNKNAFFIHDSTVDALLK